MSGIQRLPTVGTQQEFMNALEGMIVPPKSDDEAASPGSTRELKSYMMEFDGDLEPEFATSGLNCLVRNTGLDHIKILHADDGSGSYEFYLDKSDPRFLVLHTNEKSNNAGRIVEKMTHDVRHAFDYAWLHSGMLKRIVGMDGNSFRGFGVPHSDRHLRSAEADDAGIEDLKLIISGSMAKDMKKIFRRRPRISGACAHNMVRIMRGTASSGDYVQDELHHDGHFALKRGKSIDDHLALVEMCREEYSRTVGEVESLRIGTKSADGKTLFDGRPFDFAFNTEIEDLELFVSRMFNSAAPFNLWGVKSEIGAGYVGVLAIDLHAGSPIDFEIAGDAMRVYLDQGSCGNVILRLLTNLQMHHDAKDACDQVD